MNDELRVLEGAEKVLNRRGYAWFNYGQHPGPLCLGGAILSVIASEAVGKGLEITTRHPACARIVKILNRPPERTLRMSRDHDLIKDVSTATNRVPESEVRAALSQAISECRAEQTQGRELAGV